MNDLDLFRNQIDEIDEKMKQLFLKRLEIAKLIGKYKKQNNLEVNNLEREVAMFSKHKETFENKELYDLYQHFLSMIIKLSKEVQK